MYLWQLPILNTGTIAGSMYMQACKFESVQVCNLSMQACTKASMQLWNYFSMQVCEYVCMQLYMSMQLCSYYVRQKLTILAYCYSTHSAVQYFSTRTNIQTMQPQVQGRNDFLGFNITVHLICFLNHPH